MVDYFSVTHKVDRKPPMLPMDDTKFCIKLQKRMVVVKSFRASRNLHGRELPKKGHKVLLFKISSDGVMWLRTDVGRVFCIPGEKAPVWLQDMFDKRAAVDTARAAGTKAFTVDLGEPVIPWDPLTHYNPKVQSFGTDVSEADVRRSLLNAPLLPRTMEEMPVQPHGYVYPIFPTEMPPFGQYRFATEDDSKSARAFGLWSANLVMHAAQRGHPSLDDILIWWEPGMIDGTQGAFGEASAYAHLGAINSRLAHWFGLAPVDPRQLAVYAGTDPYWWESRGSNNATLHKLRGQGNPRRPPGVVRTEAEIEQQINDRQGFGAEAIRRAGPESAVLRPVEKAARDLLLRACDRSTGLGLPMSVENPMKIVKLEEDTAFHPGFVGCGYRRNMHPINYQVHRVKGMKYPGFAVPEQRTPNILPPRLNAEGEAVWAYLKIRFNGDRMQEVMAEDWPMVPSSLAVHEDPALLNAIHDLGVDWAQILVRMDPDVQSGSNYYQSACGKMRKLNGMATKGLLYPHEFTDPPNCARGHLPGIVDPTRPYSIQPTSNWIQFNLEKTTPVDRMERLVQSHAKDEIAADQQRRADLITRQSPMPVVYGRFASP